MKGHLISLGVMFGAGILSLVILIGNFPTPFQVLAFIIGFTVLLAFAVLQIDIDHIY